MTEAQYPPEIQVVLDVWQPYVASIKDWRALVKEVEPKATGCGPVYELANPLRRSTESFAVADMRGIEYALPHYHANGEIEIYFVLQGAGRVVIGNKVRDMVKGDIVVTPSDITHYAIPDRERGLVLAVVNTPPFNLANNIDVVETDPSHGYDHELFKQLTEQ